MAVNTINGPRLYEIRPAYNPITFTITTSGIVPVIYVDVYFGGNATGTYFKTISSTSPVAGSTIWFVDIRDLVQEYLRGDGPVHALTNPPFATTVNRAVAICSIRVRGSNVNGAGFVVPESPLPTQASVDTPAANGGGMASFDFLVFNGALQLEDSPSAYLALRANNVGYVRPGFHFFNLFNNRDLRAGISDYMSLPVYIPIYGLSENYDPLAEPPPSLGNDNVISYNVIEDEAGNYYWPANPGGAQSIVTFQSYAAQSLYYIPAGPKNFAGLISKSTLQPLNFAAMGRYRMVLTPTAPTGGTPYVYWKSPWITFSRPCKDRTRFRFLNLFGAYDTIRFQMREDTFNASATGAQLPNPGNYTNVNGKESYGRIRTNIRVEQRFAVTGVFKESEMKFVEQFLASPLAGIETQGLAGFPDYITPVRIMDVSTRTRKIEERYAYEVTVVVEPSNEKTSIRI